MSTETARLAAYVVAENRARLGYDFPERAAEGEWVRAHLPETQADFQAVAEAVRVTWSGARAVDVAAILVGGRVGFDSWGREAVQFARVQSDVEKWLAPAPRKARKASTRCSVCGAPATLLASGGPTCRAHYDTLS